MMTGEGGRGGESQTGSPPGGDERSPGAEECHAALSHRLALQAHIQTEQPQLLLG